MTTPISRRLAVARTLASCALALALSVGSLAAGERQGVDWPSFRGHRASGVAEGFATPARWDTDSGLNIVWRTPIPGLAHSSPVISRDRIFVTTAVRDAGEQELKVGLYGDVRPVDDEGSHEWRVLALDKHTGRLLWQRTAHAGIPRTKRHTKSSHANSTPAIDGEHLAVFFGSEGLHVFDLDGTLLWQKDLGLLDSGFFVAPTAQWGFASSPIIHAGKVIVQCDVQGEDFIAAFDVRDGREIWRTRRDEVPTWSTPTIYELDGQARLAVNGYRHIGGYDLKTGREIWRLAAGGDIPVPTPVVAHGLIFITSSHGGDSPIYAVRTSAQGDLSAQGAGDATEAIEWSKQRDGAYIPTPLVYGDHFYVCRDNGALFCYQAKTGAERYRVRLGSGGSGFSGSAVAADGKLYFTSESGQVYVVRAGPEFELLAENPLGEVAMATPAISEGRLYFRTRHHLVAVGE